ncbi:RNA polymerase-binding protein DksA [Ottowia sp.]|uniref:RNA polymerase-binding protein DksA n=1 Tax=Ottowia sp. TaxID=1898956 RepID=UPI003A862715
MAAAKKTAQSKATSTKVPTAKPAARKVVAAKRGAAKPTAAKTFATPKGVVAKKQATVAKTPVKPTNLVSSRKKSAPNKKATKAAPATAPAVAPKILPMPIVAPPPVPVAVKKNPKLANNWKSKPVEQLSDAEVIAMPDGEYMNGTQLAFFRLKLVDLKNGILANADQTAENLRDDTVVVPDPADRATIEEEHALELRTRDRERKLLKKIEQSIARIDADDYGYCDETGEPIGVPRLLARPTATLSLEAQQRREMKQKMFGD